MKEDQSVPNFPWMSWSTLKLEGQLSILDGRGKFTTFQLLYDGLLFLAKFYLAFHECSSHRKISSFNLHCQRVFKMYHTWLY